MSSTPEMRNSNPNNTWWRCFTNGVVSGGSCFWGCWLLHRCWDWMLFWQVDHRLNRWSNSLDWSNCLLIQLSLQQSHGLYHSPYDAQRTTFSSVALASQSSRPLLISCLVNTNTQVQHLSLYIPNWWCLSTATTCCRHHGHWPTSPSGQMTK